MAKANRKRNKILAAANAERAIALEQVLPPPPARIYDPDAVAQVPDTVREQQFGLYVSQLFERQQQAVAAEERLRAVAAEETAETERYERAYARRGAVTDEERGAVLAGELSAERAVKVLVALAVVLAVARLT